MNKKLFLLCISVLCYMPILSKAHESIQREYEGIKFTEIKITEKVSYKRGFFIEEDSVVDIVGILWIPNTEKNKKPLVVFNHGGQVGGSSKKVEPEYILKYFLERGFAVFSPLRKGFHRKGDEPSDASTNKTEPFQCDNFEKTDTIIKSSTQDVVKLMKKVMEMSEIDHERIIMLGFSRGTMISMQIVSENYFTGVLGVINFSSIWHGLPCVSNFEDIKFDEFSKKINIPVLFFLGDRDNYFRAEDMLKNIAKIKSSVQITLSGGGHGDTVKQENFWLNPVSKFIDSLIK